MDEKCSPYFNPADFIIDMALEDERRRFALRLGLDIPPEKQKVWEGGRMGRGGEGGRCVW